MKGSLRYAIEEDMDLLFEWANEPLVRKNAFSTEQISYEEHKKWYGQILSGNSSIQYIYVYDNEPTGQVRIDIQGDTAEIDYSVCLEKRGMGHGKNILQLLYNQVRVDFPNIKKLVAKVKSGNIASQQAFLESGYSEVYEMFEIIVDKST